MAGLKRCEGPECRRMTRTAYGSETNPMFLCSNCSPRARRHIEARDQAIRTTAFKEGQTNYDKDVIVPFTGQRRGPR